MDGDSKMDSKLTTRIKKLARHFSTMLGLSPCGCYWKDIGLHHVLQVAVCQSTGWQRCQLKSSEVPVPAGQSLRWPRLLQTNCPGSGCFGAASVCSARARAFSAASAPTSTCDPAQETRMWIKARRVVFDIIQAMKLMGEEMPAFEQLAGRQFPRGWRGCFLNFDGVAGAYRALQWCQDRHFCRNQS